MLSKGNIFVILQVCAKGNRFSPRQWARRSACTSLMRYFCVGRLDVKTEHRHCDRLVRRGVAGQHRGPSRSDCSQPLLMYKMHDSSRGVATPSTHTPNTIFRPARYMPSGVARTTSTFEGVSPPESREVTH